MKAELMTRIIRLLQWEEWRLCSRGQPQCECRKNSPHARRGHQ
jgi:hypothetical protein